MDPDHIAISLEDLLDYFELRLPEDRVGTIEEHLGACEACAEQARQVRLLGHMLEGWTARRHGAAVIQARLARAVQRAQALEANLTWRERLRQWQERWAGKAGAVARIVLETPEKASRILTEGLEAISRPEQAWAFELVPASRPVPTLGMPPKTGGIVSAGKPIVKVKVSGGALQVRVTGLQAIPLPPLVLMISMEEGGEPRLAELKQQPGSKDLIARFTGIAPGEYIIAFEPIEPSR